MGTLVVKDVMARVATALFDTNNAKWSPLELLGYLNDGQRYISTLQPTGVIASAPVVAGARQALPSDGWLLLDVLRNLGASGTTPGRAIRVISRRLLEGFNPTWMTSTPSAVVQSYIYDLRDQTNYFVYPPSTGGVFVEINYATVPPLLTSTMQAISILDVFEEALYNYMMYRACSKITEYSPGQQVASGYWTLLSEALGGKSKTESSFNPNAALEPAIPGTSIEGES